MRLVNESGQAVDYWIQCANNIECGSIAVDGYVDLPEFDNQQNVYCGFDTSGTTQTQFTINCTNTGTDQQVEMALIAAAGDPSTSKSPSKS
jgi:hypothetical protein